MRRIILPVAVALVALLSTSAQASPFASPSPSASSVGRTLMPASPSPSAAPTSLTVPASALPSAGSSADATQQPSATPSRTASRAVGARGEASVRTVTDTRYGSGKRQTLRVYWNASSAPKPVLVLIHGGYWYEQSNWSTWAGKFAEEGFQVVSIQYRLNFEAAWPAQRQDVASAVAWIRAHADEYDADPQNIAVLGSSAGGQLATDAATNGTNALGLKGIVALSPVASPYRAWVDGNTSSEPKVRKVRDNAAILARCYPDSTDNGTDLRDSGCWDTWRSMVSKNWVNPGDAPMFLIHSDGDFVPSSHSTDLEATAEAKGVPDSAVETKIVANSTAHGGTLLSASGVYDDVVKWLRARTV